MSAGGEYLVRPFAPGDEEPILDLWYRVFKEDNPDLARRSLEFWRQLFIDNPAGMQTFVAEDDDGNIIGNYASMPAYCSVRGDRRLCTQVVDTAVDPAWRKSLRKKSVFVVLGREFLSYWTTEGRRPYNQYIYGLPNKRAFPAGVRILGYKPVLRPLVALRRDIDAAWVASLQSRAGEVSVEPLDVAAPGAGAALFAEHIDQVPLGTWRDEPYLQWRFRPRGDVVYEARLARRGGRPIMAAWFRRGWAGKPQLAVVDWIGRGDDVEALAALLAAMADEAPVQEHLATWVMPHTSYWSGLESLGLQPEPTDFNLCIIDYGPDWDFEWARQNWFFTMADSDIY
jgi:hypothetical protein